jgi:hypothetical protein
MKTKAVSALAVALLTVSLTTSSYAANTTQAAPATLASMPLTVSSGATANAPVAMPSAPAPVAKSESIPDSPTLGDWDALAQRKAYKEALKKVEGDDAKQSAPSPLPQNLGPLPPLPAPSAAKDEPKKKERFSASCPDDNKPCFFSVYGMSMEGYGNNYRGLFAINGRVVPVHKGAKFNGYTVTAISTHELTAVDAKGRTHVWPYAGDADLSPDPEEIAPKKTASATNSPMSTFIPLGPPAR